MQAKVLVIDADWVAGIETIQSLGGHGCTIHAAGLPSDQGHRRSRYIDRQIELNLSAEDAGCRLAGLFREEQYDLIVPVTDVAILAMLSTNIPDQMYKRSVLASRQSVHTALNKESVWNLAVKLNIRVPDSQLVSGPNQPPVAFPVVLKPIFSKKFVAGKIHHYPVTVARNPEEWRSAFATKYREIPVQQQQYLFGSELGVEMLFEHGVLRWSFLHERIHELPLTGGASSYRRSIAPRDGLVESTAALLSALEWHGVAMAEYKVTSNGEAYLMELNPRLWGSLPLAIDCGMDFPYGLLCLATNQPLPPQPSYRVGYFARNLRRDVEWFESNLQADHSDPLLHTRPTFRSLLELFRPLIGRESWDLFRWSDLGLTLAGLTSIFREHVPKAARAVGKRIRPVFHRSNRKQQTVL